MFLMLPLKSAFRGKIRTGRDHFFIFYSRFRVQDLTNATIG